MVLPNLHTSGNRSLLTARGSGGFLQSDQPSLWLNNGVLLTAVMSGDESNGRVRSANAMTRLMLIVSRFEYLWQDTENFKRPTKMPAPEYVEHLMGWVQSNIDNEQMFPSRIGMFPGAKQYDSC